MTLRKYLTGTKQLVPTAIILPWLILLAACGNTNDNPDNGPTTIVPILSSEALSVKQGESVSLTVDIDPSLGASVAGYTINMPETEAKISISTNSCASNIGTSSCEDWTITPEASAIPGSYFISVRANSPSQEANLLEVQFNLQVLANTDTTPAQAAVGISGENGVWHIRTTDESRWSWDTDDPAQAIANNLNGGTGVGGYFLFDEQGTIQPNSVTPSSVYMAAKDDSNHLWQDMNGNNRQGLSLNDSGDVYSWGFNSTALGYSESSPQLFPKIIPNLTNVSKIETSTSTSFALMNGEVIVWGSNLDGLHGKGDATPDEDNSVIFTTIPGLTNVIDISAGENHVIALKDDGTAWSWGLNNQGQLGLDIANNTISIPTQIISLSNVKQISAAGNFSLALLENGTVWSWGDNSRNQLGIGSNQDFIGSPQQVTGFTKAFKIAAMFQGGESMGFVYDETTGFVWRWGEDLDRPTEIRFMVTEIGPGLVLDRSCDALELPSGQSARAGFLWDVRKSPTAPPKLLSFFGVSDPSCPNKLFLETGGKGTITASPQSDSAFDSYSTPTQVQLTATPNPGWQIDPLNPWSGNPDCDDRNVFVQGGIQCIANFISSDSKLLTVSKFGTGNGVITSDIAGINCGTSCSANITSGETIVLTATADIESDFAGWSGTGNCATPDNVVDNAVTVTLTEDSDCQASFNKKSFVLTVTKNGSGDGTIASDITAIDCGADCDASLDINTQVVLTATPDASSNFASWSGTGDCQSPTTLVDNSVTITVSQDSECTATFDPAATGDMNLTVIINGGPHAGEVNSSEFPIPTMQCLNSGSEGESTTCNASYPVNSNVTLVASLFFPNNTLNVTGCDSFVGANFDCVVTMDQDKIVTFDISESPEYDISATATGNGSIISFASGAEVGVRGRIECPSVNCADTFIVPAGAPTVVNFEAHSDAGSAFVSWGANQCDSEQIVTGVGICTVNLVPGSPTVRQIDATFQ